MDVTVTCLLSAIARLTDNKEIYLNNDGVIVNKKITNQNNGSKYVFNRRIIDNLNKLKNYVIVAEIKLNLELEALVIREQSIFKQF